MQKHPCAHWFLETIAQMVVERVAPGRSIIPVIKYDDDQIEWYGKAFGRSPWWCDYILPTDDSVGPDLVPTLNAAMARWQERYDLALTSR
jgi:hypothetical protein